MDHVYRWENVTSADRLREGIYREKLSNRGFLLVNSPQEFVGYKITKKVPTGVIVQGEFPEFRLSLDDVQQFMGKKKI